MSDHKQVLGTELDAVSSERGPQHAGKGFESRIDVPEHLVKVVSRPHSKHSRTLISVVRLSLWMWLDI